MELSIDQLNGIIQELLEISKSSSKSNSLKLLNVVDGLADHLDFQTVNQMYKKSIKEFKERLNEINKGIKS